MYACMPIRMYVRMYVKCIIIVKFMLLICVMFFINVYFVIFAMINIVIDVAVICTWYDWWLVYYISSVTEGASCRATPWLSSPLYSLWWVPASSASYLDAWLAACLFTWA